MKTSPDIGALASALAKAQAAIEPPTKHRTAKVQTRTGRDYEYSYADLAHVIEAVRKPLNDNGLSFTQPIEADNGQTKLLTVLIHESGQWIESSYPLPSGLSPQEFGSALTYARRYSLCGILGIAAEEDDDGEAATSGREKAKPKTAAKKADAPEPEVNLGDAGEEKPKTKKPIPDGPTYNGSVARVKYAAKESDDGSWVKDEIVFEDESVMATFSRTVAQDADKYRENRMPVIVVYKQTKYGKQAIHIREAF